MFRNYRERILFVVLAVIVVVLTINISSALAGWPEKCDDWPFLDMVCIEQVSLDDMGTFNADGSFTWNMTFVNEFSAWASSGGTWPTDWETRYAPRLLGAVVKNTRMDFKHFADADPHVRVAVMLIDGGYEIPSIMRVESPNGEQTGYFSADYEPPEGCICDENGCNPQAICDQVWMDIGFDQYIDDVGNSVEDEFGNPTGQELTSDQLGNMLWENKGEIVPLTLVDKSCFYGVNYNDAREVKEWEDAGWDDCPVDNYYVFPDNILPDFGENTFILTYGSNQTITLKYDAVNIGDMPVVPAQYSEAVTIQAGKSGKQVTTGQTMTVDNITVREISGALIVQWAEPDLAMFPDPNAWRKELQMAVGTPHDASTGLTYEGHLLWIGSPYQIGSVVVPPHLFEFIKDKVRDDGGNRLEIEFQYRFKYQPTQEGFYMYQNRGYSESVFLTFE